jgi:hypothetical protein
VHVYSADGALVSFTYDDHLLGQLDAAQDNHDAARRNIGVSIVDHPVKVPPTHPRNHSGSAFSVLVTRTSSKPRTGSDEYSRAYEEGWVGTNGYLRRDGTRQKRSLAFLGDVSTADGKLAAEVFIADLPEDLTIAGEAPLAGSATRLPYPPRGVQTRRLTRTLNRKYPGIQGPRHWLRSSPDGSSIAMLMRDDAGVVQLFTVGPEGDEPHQVTRNPHDISSAFTWSPDGRWIAHTMDNSVCVTDAQHGQTHRLTEKSVGENAPLPLACVFCPDGQAIAYLRQAGGFNEVFTCQLKT